MREATEKIDYDDKNEDYYSTLYPIDKNQGKHKELMAKVMPFVSNQIQDFETYFKPSVISSTKYGTFIQESDTVQKYSLVHFLRYNLCDYTQGTYRADSFLAGPLPKGINHKDVFWGLDHFLVPSDMFNSVCKFMPQSALQELEEIEFATFGFGFDKSIDKKVPKVFPKNATKIELGNWQADSIKTIRKKCMDYTDYPYIKTASEIKEPLHAYPTDNQIILDGYGKGFKIEVHGFANQYSINDGTISQFGLMILGKKGIAKDIISSISEAPFSSQKLSEAINFLKYPAETFRTGYGFNLDDEFFRNLNLQKLYFEIKDDLRNKSNSISLENIIL